MNKARGEFYKLKRECDIYHEGMMPEIINYVTKLELKLNESEQAEKDLSALLIECKHKIELLEKKNKELMEYINNQADEYEDESARKFLLKHKHYIIQNKPEDNL